MPTPHTPPWSSAVARTPRRDGPPGGGCAQGRRDEPCYNHRPVSIDRIPLPAHVPGRLYATGFTDVGPDPDGALASVEGDVLLCLLTAEDIAMRFPRYADWLAANAEGRGRWFPIEDGGVAPDEDMGALVAELAAQLAEGRAIVTHCGAGIGRTSLACGLTLVALGREDLPTALAEVRAARSGAGPENPVQVAHLERMALRLTSGRAGS